MGGSPCSFVIRAQKGTTSGSHCCPMASPPMNGHRPISSLLLLLQRVPGAQTQSFGLSPQEEIPKQAAAAARPLPGPAAQMSFRVPEDGPGSNPRSLSAAEEAGPSLESPVPEAESSKEISTVTQKMEELQLAEGEAEGAKESRGAIYSVPLFQDPLQVPEEPSKAFEEAAATEPEESGPGGCDRRSGGEEGEERVGSCARRPGPGRWQERRRGIVLDQARRLLLNIA